MRSSAFSSDPNREKNLPSRSHRAIIRFPQFRMRKELVPHPRAIIGFHLGHSLKKKSLTARTCDHRLPPDIPPDKNLFSFAPRGHQLSSSATLPTESNLPYDPFELSSAFASSQIQKNTRTYALCGQRLLLGSQSKKNFPRCANIGSLACFWHTTG